MFRTPAFSLALLSLLAVSCVKPPEANPFVGTWKLVSIERRHADGSLVPGVNPVGGVDPTGIVMYDAAGHVSLQIMPSGRAQTVNTLQPLTVEQAQAALFGCVMYYGTYTLDQAKRIMTIHFDGALSPSMIGTTGQRFYEINGNRMSFRPSLESGANLLTWERVG